MYRVLIADDESLSRFVIKTIISKNIFSLEVVGEAENGRQAIEMNRTLKPDIIIMDIKMPGINGIDATRDILLEFPNVSILILTAYDNFDYIKRALDLGVKGYILKPVKEDELVEKVNKVISEFDDKLNNSELKQEIESKIKIVRPLIENELVSSFVSGNFNVDKVNNYLNFLQIVISSGYFMLISSGEAISKDINETIRQRILKDKMYDIAQKHLNMMKKCYFGNCIGNTIIVFFPVKDEELKYETYKEAILIGREIKSRMKVIENIDVAIGIGNVYTGIQNLSKSYNEANLALKKAVSGREVIYFGSLDENDWLDSQIKYPIELENKLIEQIKIGSMENARELADNIITCIISSTCKVDYIKECLTEFFTVLKRNAVKIGANPFNIGYSRIVNELSVLNDIDEIYIWCKTNVNNLLDIIEKRSVKNKDVVSMVLEYINKYFTSDITLESVADEVGISPQYLSKIFKEKYGSNFIDYITRKRIELAEELLGRRDADIKEVSKAVGYGDTYYFCKVFKRDTGLTPKQFQAQKIIGEL